MVEWVAECYSSLYTWCSLHRAAKAANDIDGWKLKPALHKVDGWMHLSKNDAHPLVLPWLVDFKEFHVLDQRFQHKACVTRHWVGMAKPLITKEWNSAVVLFIKITFEKWSNSMQFAKMCNSLKHSLRKNFIRVKRPIWLEMRWMGSIKTDFMCS